MNTKLIVKTLILTLWTIINLWVWSYILNKFCTVEQWWSNPLILTAGIVWIGIFMVVICWDE